MSKPPYLSRLSVILNISRILCLACNHGRNQFLLVLNTLSGTLADHTAAEAQHLGCLRGGGGLGRAK